MEQPGARLKAARVARGRSLQDIAAATKISVTALEALERNDFSKLPGGIFGRAFIRAYAVEVGLDPELTVSEFATAVKQHEANADKRLRPPDVTFEDRQFLERQRQAARALRLALVVLAVAAVALAVWRTRPWWSGAPAATPTPLAAPAVSRDYRPPPPASPPPAPRPTATPAASAPASTAAVPGAPTTAAALSAPTASAASGLTISFNITADCWVQVSADGLVVLERLMKPGEHQMFAADHEMALNIGDAGAFTWSINGRPAKPLGKSGAHKEVHVTLANLSDFLQEVRD